MSKDDEPFEGVLGNTVELRLLDHLLATPKMDFNVTELARAARISRPSVDESIKKFLQWGIARVTAKRGNMNFYSINEESPIVDAIYIFSDAIIEKINPEAFEEVDATIEIVEASSLSGEAIQSKSFWTMNSSEGIFTTSQACKATSDAIGLLTKYDSTSGTMGCTQ